MSKFSFVNPSKELDTQTVHMFQQYFQIKKLYDNVSRSLPNSDSTKELKQILFLINEEAKNELGSSVEEYFKKFYAKITFLATLEQGSLDFILSGKGTGENATKSNKNTEKDTLLESSYIKVPNPLNKCVDMELCTTSDENEILLSGYTNTPCLDVNTEAV